MPRRQKEIRIAPIAVRNSRRLVRLLDLVYLALAFYSGPLLGALLFWGWWQFRVSGLIYALIIGGAVGAVAAVLMIPVSARCLEDRPLRVVFWGVVAPSACVAAAAGYFLALIADPLLTGIAFAPLAAYLGLCHVVSRLSPRPKPGICPSCGYPIDDAGDNSCPSCGEEFVFVGQRVELPQTECSGCGYSLEGLTSGVCPECGLELRLRSES